MIAAVRQRKGERRYGELAPGGLEQKKGSGESSDDEKVLVLLVQEHETGTTASKCRRKL